ncbi:MAG TPA: hypothetical protein VK211_24035 [Kamptonema sp.]|nr:hypothetical protein [Kamptonema sp.]
MPRFNLKLLTFYAVTIGFVVVLFKVVTAYGESNLKAPPPISGHYRIQAQNLPGCLKAEALVLSISQSGIYLNGSLLPDNGGGESEINSEEKPSLVGKWENKELMLSGSVPHLIACDRAADTTKGSSETLVRIQGVIEGDILKGKIVESSVSQSIDFSAQREAMVKKPKKEH